MYYRLSVGLYINVNQLYTDLTFEKLSFMDFDAEAK